MRLYFPKKQTSYLKIVEKKSGTHVDLSEWRCPLPQFSHNCQSISMLSTTKQIVTIYDFSSNLRPAQLCSLLRSRLWKDNRKQPLSYDAVLRIIRPNKLQLVCYMKERQICVNRSSKGAGSDDAAPSDLNDNLMGSTRIQFDFSGRRRRFSSNFPKIFHSLKVLCSLAFRSPFPAPNKLGRVNCLRKSR